MHPGPGRCVSAAGNCCISKVGGAARAAGCDRCGDTPACCQDDKSYKCAVCDGTPGVVGALDHVLLASTRLWNDTTAKRSYTPATNLADLQGRSVAAAGDYSARSPPLQPHNNCYIEANLLATPQFQRDHDTSASDVLFVIGTFPFLFDNPNGADLRAWAKQLSDTGSICSF